MPLRAFAAAFLLMASARVSPAHEFTITEVVAVLKSDRTYLIDMTVDIDALSLGAAPSTPSATLASQLRSLSADEFEKCVATAKETILRRVRVRFDGHEEKPIISFPESGNTLAERLGEPSVLGTTARLTGEIPRDAASFTFWASRSFSAVHLTILDQASLSGARIPLGAGEESPPFRIGAPDSPGTLRPGIEPSNRGVALRYIVLGFEHILPLGIDHILFVLGLFLLSAKMGPLLLQVTAFTIAHSVTLILAAMGVVSLPARLVESLIALSIAYVAIENLATKELKPWRLAVVFLFGLLHGLGFAGVLRELGLPQGAFLPALLSFNIGVELGQIAVVLLAFAAVGWYRQKEWYRPRIVIPISAAIALIGLYWSVARAVL